MGSIFWPSLPGKWQRHKITLESTGWPERRWQRKLAEWLILRRFSKKPFEYHRENWIWDQTEISIKSAERTEHILILQRKMDKENAANPCGCGISAAPRRFELPTPRLGGVCSIQLSYEDLCNFYRKERANLPRKRKSLRRELYKPGENWYNTFCTRARSSAG